METIPPLDDAGCRGHEDGARQSTEGGPDAWMLGATNRR